MHVIGRRPDRYHLLESLVVFAAVHDTVAVAPAEGLSLRVTGPFADRLRGEGKANLVMRAARKLAAAAGVPARAAITLDKRLPVAAGLGGGSSDAAASLRALCRLWGLDGAREDLPTIAVALGADVPVCLHGRAAHVSGIGEALAPVPGAWPDCAMVLASPPVPLATAEVFAARQGPFGAADPLTRLPPTPRALIDAIAARRNDLEPAARSLAPVVAELRAALADLPGCRLARMSGSGPTCFALFETADDAAAGAVRLAAARRQWWIAASPIVTAVSSLAVEPAPAVG